MKMSGNFFQTRTTTNMKTSKYRTTIIIAVTLVVIAAIYTRLYHNQNDLLKVEVASFRTTGGWGYEIKVDNNTYIHQKTIPAVPGERKFLSEQDALRTGNAVMEKLTRGEHPSLSYEEVMALGLRSMLTGP